jgi:hypothetical protein
MKTPLLLLLGLGSFAFAGTPSKQVIESPPAPEPSIWTWFAGASAGYLFEEYDTEIYSLHVGVDTPWRVGPLDIALFLEVSYFEPDDVYQIWAPFQTVPVRVDLDADLDIIPVTLNVKFEHSFNNGLGFYFGGGAGVAFVDLDLHGDSAFGPDFHYSDSDTVFAAQAFAGLVYNFSENAEVYTQIKWLYLDDMSDYDLQDDFAAELGFRWNF